MTLLEASVVTLAAIFPPTQPPERIVAVAAAADAAGLAELWVWEDCFFESGIATATAMLAATSRVTVGIGLLPVPLRNVALTAMELATVSRLFPGRLVAGVGHGVLDWMGQAGARVESPMTLLREYTAALYALLHGETVTTRGRYVNLDAVALDWPPAVAPPLLVGGIRPRTVSLAGELADALPTATASSNIIRHYKKRIRPHRELPHHLTCTALPTAAHVALPRELPRCPVPAAVAGVGHGGWTEGQAAPGWIPDDAAARVHRRAVCLAARRRYHPRPLRQPDPSP